jgi:hypothetical protein
MNILIFLKVLLLTYWTDALLVVAVVTVLSILYKRGKKDLVKEIIYDLVVKAEKELGSATGGAKYSQVISALYLKLPFILKLFFTKAELNKYIDDAVKWLKNKLKNPNINLLSYAEESTNKPIILNIENSKSESKINIEDMAKELEFYRNQNNLST